MIAGNPVMAGNPIDLDNPRNKERFRKAIDWAILEGDGRREWEDLMGLMGRALALYDDPAFELQWLDDDNHLGRNL